MGIKIANYARLNNYY